MPHYLYCMESPLPSSHSTRVQNDWPLGLIMDNLIACDRVQRKRTQSIHIAVYWDGSILRCLPGCRKSNTLASTTYLQVLHMGDTSLDNLCKCSWARPHPALINSSVEYPVLPKRRSASSENSIPRFPMWMTILSLIEGGVFPRRLIVFGTWHWYYSGINAAVIGAQSLEFLSVYKGCNESVKASRSHALF